MLLVVGCGLLVIGYLTPTTNNYQQSQQKALTTIGKSLLL